MKSSCEKAVFALCLLFAAALSPAQTFTHLLDFNFTDGSAPASNLLQATDGNLYGYTTEGGLDIITHKMRAADAIHRLQDAGISVSLFLDPESRQIEEAARLKTDAVELHTGQYAESRPGATRQKQLEKLETIGAMIRQSGMALHAGHGLNYHNVRPVAAIEGMHELNIGHSIVARAVMIGFQEAVREMKQLVM